MAVEQRRQRRAAAGGVDHEIGPQLLAVVGDDPDDVGHAVDAVSSPVSRPFTATPRRTVTFGRRRRGARANAASTIGRRPVMASNRSSPSRAPPVISSGQPAIGL